MFKLIASPLLILAATYAGRRWGPAVSGWLVAFPFISGPIAYFLILEHGAGFGLVSVGGMLSGVVSDLAFLVTYSVAARRGLRPLSSLGVSLGAFFLVTALWTAADWPVAARAGMGLVALLVAAQVVPAKAVNERHEQGSPWDLPGRMAVAAAMVLALTEAAPWLGPGLTGLLSPFPVFASILAVASHASEGAAPAVQLLHGVVMGLFSFWGFFVGLCLALPRCGTAWGFVLATGAALGVQAITVRALRGERISPPRATGRSA